MIWGDIPAITKSVKFINGPSQENNFVKLHLPDLYLRMWSFYNIIQQQYDQLYHFSQYPITKFPNLFLDITDYDISNQIYTIKYKITVKEGFTISSP